MNRRTEDAGEIPWPALVDLLTSVLITFMFFILVTTVAMSAMTMKVQEDKTKQREDSKTVSETEVISPTDIALSQSAMSAAISATEITTSTLLPPPTSSLNSETPISPDETERLKEENEILKQQLAAMGASFMKSKSIRITQEPAENAITLLFNPNEAGMTPEVEAALATFITQVRQSMGQSTAVEITASEPTGTSFSQGRERALTRAMVVRNVLLEQKVEATRIQFLYSTENRYKSTNWVRVRATGGEGAAQ